jgi:hypothetical protein
VGRIEKIKRQLIEESNKRILGEQTILPGLGNNLINVGRAGVRNLKRASKGSRTEYDDGVVNFRGSNLIDRDMEDIVYDLFNEIAKTPHKNIFHSDGTISVYRGNVKNPNYYLYEYMWDLKKAMEGWGGNSEVLTILSKLSLSELSTIIHNWKKAVNTEDSLYEWLDGELGLSWDDIWDSIGDFKNNFNIPTQEEDDGSDWRTI